MKRVLAGLVCLLGARVALADDGALLQRIVALESRLASLEHQLAPVLEAERVKRLVEQHQQQALERMMKDADVYPRAMLREIETLYKKCTADWKSEDCLAGLKALVERCPTSNRAGCALLNLGQMTEGDEQIEYLSRAIARHGDCYFSDGVQVGAYGRLYLGMRYKRDGKDDKAEALFEQVRREFSDAVDHKGRLLSDSLKGL